MPNNIQYSNAFGANILSTTEQSDGSHALNVVLANAPMRDTSVYYASPTGGSSNMAVTGGALAAGASTITTASTPGAANYTRFRRTRYTGAAVAASASGPYVGYTRWFRGANGGFDAFIQFGQGVDSTGYSAFVGLSTLTAALTSSTPSTLTDCVGVGYDATDAAGGTWFLIYNDAAGGAVKTAIPLMTRDTTSGFNMRISCPAGASSSITISINDAHTGGIELAPTVLTTDLPTANTAMSIGAHMYNGALTTSTIMDVSRIYVSCNY